MNFIGTVKSVVYSYISQLKPATQAKDGSILDWLFGDDSEAADFVNDSLAIPAPVTAGCTTAPTTNVSHFYLTGEARNDWDKAADQVLRSYCGISSPSGEQVQKMHSGLVQANEQHLRSDVAGLISYYLSTPRGVDHRVGLFLQSNTEIFVPPAAQICPAPAAPAQPPAPPVVQPPPVVPVLPPSGHDATSAPDVTPPPAQQDVGTPDVTPPPAHDVAAPEAPAVNHELEQLKAKINTAIGRTSALINKLNATGDSHMSGLAAGLNQKKNALRQALDSGNLDQMQSALQQFNSARRDACQQYNTLMNSIGGETITCQ